MNTLRRITHHMVKAVSVGAVLVAASLPLAATAASAATSPSIACSQLGSAPVNGNPFVCGALPYVPAGSTLSFYIFGANFANDNGSATVTTTAPGVTGGVTELSATMASVTLYTSATTTPGYYPITLTDDNGTATLATAFGIDPTASVSGAVPSSIAVGSTRLITVTGVGLTTGSATIVPPSGLSITNEFASTDGTSLTFDATGTAVGTYSITIGAAQLSLAVTGPSITAVSVASSTGYLVMGAAVTSQMVTISGSGFEAGASVQIAGSALPNVIDGVTFGAPTVASNTAITVSATVPTTGVTNGQYTVRVINPDGTTVSAANALGFGVAGAPLSTSSATLTLVTNGLVPGGTASIVVAPSPGFSVTTGAVVNLSVGSVSFTGTVTGIDASGNISIAFYLPANLSTTLTSAIGAGVTQLPLANLSGIAAGTQLTFADNGDTTTVSAVNPASSSVTVGATANAHGTGTVVQWPITTSGLTFTLSINNGTQTASLSNLPVLTAGAMYSYLDTSGTQVPLATGSFPLAPGTYTYLMTAPGANMGVGTKISFVDTTSPYAGTNPDGLTGTIVATGPDTATVRVTVAGGTVPVSAGTLSAGPVNAAGNTWINLSAGGLAIYAGEVLNIPADTNTINAESVTVASTWTTADASAWTANSPIPITTALKYTHLGGEAVTTPSTSIVTNQAYDAVITNAAGVNTTFPFATTANPNFSLTTLTVNGQNTVGNNAGLNGLYATLTITGSFGDGNPLDYVVTSSTPGVSFAGVTGVNATTLTALMAVAAGTPVNTNVQVTVTDLAGVGTASLPSTTAASSGLLIGVAPTITAVSAMPTLTAGESAAFTITGTGFDPASVTFLNETGLFADAGNLAGAPDTGTNLGHDGHGTRLSCALVSSTAITCTVSVGQYATNGQHDLYLQNNMGGVATFANVLNVSMPTVATVAPATGQTVTGSTQSYVLSGISGVTVSAAAIAASPPNLGVKYSTWTANGSPGVTEVAATAVSYYGPNALLVTIPTPAAVVEGSLVFTVWDVTGTAQGTVQFDAPMVPMGQPIVGTDTGVSLSSGTSTSFAIDAMSIPSTGSATIGGYVWGNIGTPSTYLSAFMSGATVTSSTPGITTSGLTVLPGLITGTVNVASTVAAGTYDLLVTNPDGSVAVSTVTVSAGPAVAAVNGTSTITGPVSFLAGTQATLTITGSNFQQGAVVSTTTSGVATFGTTVVNGPGTQITVPVTFTNFSGATPVSLNLVITNPTTGGSTTVPAELVVNPSPTVIGTYYVPTFTSNTQVVISGTGFESGITATSSNADYTVTAVSSTPSTVTLIVTTDSNATSGTSSNVTLTNPDGGTVTFALNGGPNPNTIPRAPHAIRTVGPVWTGKTSTVKIVGSAFFGQPKITSNVGGTRVGVVHDTGSILTLRVTVAKTTKRGIHTFKITFANGDVTTVKYNQR